MRRRSTNHPPLALGERPLPSLDRFHDLPRRDGIAKTRWPLGRSIIARQRRQIPTRSDGQFMDLSPRRSFRRTRTADGSGIVASGGGDQSAETAVSHSPFRSRATADTMPGMSDRKKPGVAFWATVAVVVPLLTWRASDRRVTFFATRSSASIQRHVYFPILRAAPTCSRVGRCVHSLVCR